VPYLILVAGRPVLLRLTVGPVDAASELARKGVGRCRSPGRRRVDREGVSMWPFDHLARMSSLNQPTTQTAQQSCDYGLHEGLKPSTSKNEQGNSLEVVL